MRSVSYPYQLTDGSRLHLVHAPAAMQLDRCFNNAEVEGDRIVEASACHPMQNLTLSGSHRIEALDHRGFRPPRGIHRNGRNHGVMQCLGPYRLGERSEERRVGQEGFSSCSSRGSTVAEKKQQKTIKT